jgi:hypothetical protein
MARNWCIGVAAPLLAIVYPNIAVCVGTLAGLWMFLGRTTLYQLERRSAERAARSLRRCGVRQSSAPCRSTAGRRG